MEDYCQYQQRLMGTVIPSSVTAAFKTFWEPFWTVPFMQKLMGKTSFGLIFQARMLVREKRPLEALSLLLSALRTRHFWLNHSQKWWRLMIQAIVIAQDLAPWSQKRMGRPFLRLLSLIQHAPQPWQGREVAYCFATLSLWSFQEGQTQKALDKIRIATHADPQWGYAEYLLGWYGLLLEDIEPIPHFVRAMTIETNLWQNFCQDPLVCRFPEIRQKVEQMLQKKGYTQSHEYQSEKNKT